MDLLKNILMQKKYFESIDEVEEILASNDIDPNSMLQSLKFDKSVYPTEEDAKLYAREHGYEVEVVVDSGGGITVHQLDDREFIESTLKGLELANGVVAVVGVLKIDAIDGGLLEVYLSEKSKTYKLNEALPHIIKLATVVEGYHASYGKVSITKNMLKSFADNHSNEVYGVDLMIDYDHEQRGAAGWVKSVFLSVDGETLFGEVRWTPKGALSLSDREFRYFSPEFTDNYVHPHTRESHGPTLLGGGLVNRPFLKMDAIVTFKEKTKTNNEVKMETVLLSEHNAVKADLNVKLSALELASEKAKTIMAGQKEEIKTLSEANAKLVKDQADADIKAKHEKLFSEKKINAAQLKALTEGKDPLEVFALSENINTSSEGSGSSNTESITLSDSDEAARKLMDISKEDYIKYNKLV